MKPCEGRQIYINVCFILSHVLRFKLTYMAICPLQNIILALDAFVAPQDFPKGKRRQ